LWNCPQCGEQIEDTFDCCWKCGTGSDGTPPAEGEFQAELDDPSVPDPGPAPPPTDPPDVEETVRDDLVKLTAFGTVTEAKVARLALREEGVAAYLADDDLITTNWLLANAVGGVKLLVASSDADRAIDILAKYKAEERASTGDMTGKDMTFACQNCKETISFAGDRAGHVEVCPKCGSYVDVPHRSEDGRENACKLDDRDQSAPRTTAQLWLEVLAVLSLFYLPALFFGTVSLWEQDEKQTPMILRELHYLIYSIQEVCPLLLIIALTKDRWSLFGIVRPKWITDLLIGLVLWMLGMMAYNKVFAISVPYMSENSTTAALAGLSHWGPTEYLILFISYCINSFKQELFMRGYLIPRFERLLGATWLAVLASSILFSSYHIYQGFGGVINAFVFGAVYAIAFCAFRRIWPLCIGHTLHNFLISII
jgi:membrane protease YdiL (CAAX protease family)